MSTTVRASCLVFLIKWCFQLIDLHPVRVRFLTLKDCGSNVVLNWFPKPPPDAEFRVDGRTRPLGGLIDDAQCPPFSIETISEQACYYLAFVVLNNV